MSGALPGTARGLCSLAHLVVLIGMMATIFKLFRHNPDDPHSLSGNAIRALLEDHAGVLWIGTWSKGLNQFDRETERFMRYRDNPDDPYSLSNDSIRTMYEARSGTLWVGTMGGLNRYNRDSKQFTRYVHNPDDSNSLSHNSVRVIYKDQAGVLWVGTEGDLDQFEPATERFHVTPMIPIVSMLTVFGQF